MEQERNEMAIISKEEVFENTTEYICEIWEKTLLIYYESQSNSFMIINDFKPECPKCGLPYDKPEHGQEMTCNKCEAQFAFFGACHPKPIGSTRLEVKKALEWQ